MKIKMKMLMIFLFAIGISSASQLVGVTVNNDSGQIGIFPVGPESITIQYGTGVYQTVEAYEYSTGMNLPLPWNWPMFELSLTEASQGVAVDCCEANSLYDFEVSAELTTFAPSQDVQIAIWYTENPTSGFPLTTAAYNDILSAEAVVNAGGLDQGNFVVLTPDMSNGVSPSFIAQIAGFSTPPGDPGTSTPEPWTCLMIGGGLLGIGLVKRNKARG